MKFKKTALALFLFIFFSTLRATAQAFPPQSIELMPGYTAPDSASDGGPSVNLRYFLHFPSLYLAAGIGVGKINIPANHRNLAIDSDLKMTPVGFTLRLSPLLFESFATFVEIGADRLFSLHYELDPSVNTGENDICFVDPGIGPTPCRKTAIKESSVAYRFGAGIEKVFRSGFGIGLHYTFRRGDPLERVVSETPELGVTATRTTREDLFKIRQSIFSILISYRFW